MKITPLFLTCLFILPLFACNNSATKTEEKDKDSSTLNEVLEEKKARFSAKAPEEKKRIYAEGIAKVIADGILDSAINVGDIAPNFILTNANGASVELYSELDKGSVILVWYRGGWCPYCNLTLKYLQDWLPKYQKEGASLIALTPELPDSSLSTKQKNDLSFYVLSDLENQIAYTYNIVYNLTPEVAKKYQASFGLHSYNGDTSNTMPLAATYIIGKDKKVKYAFLDADYRNRAEPSVILDELKKLN